MKIRLTLLALVATALLPAALQTAAVAQTTAAARFQIPATDDGLPGAGPIRRYQWFKDLWVQRRVAWAKQVERDQGAVVFLGDSITQGWGDDMKNAFPGMKVANRGISGDTTRGVLIRMDEDVLALKPAGVVILIGTNDLEEQADPETIAANLKLILAKLKAHNRTLPIILNKVFPSAESKKRPADKIKRINELYAAAVKGDSQITVMETWVLFADAKGDAKPGEFPDLLHPNDAGYAMWAAGIRPVLETMGLLPVAADTFKPEAGFESLFNGRDLTGWGYRVTSEADKKSAEGWRKSDPNAPPWPFYDQAVNFDGKAVSNDGRYLAKNGRLVDATPPEGRKTRARAPRLRGSVRRRHQCYGRAALPRSRKAHDRVARSAAPEPRVMDRPREPHGVHPGRRDRQRDRGTARPPRLYHRPRARFGGALDAGRLDRDQRQRHEEEPLWEYRGPRALDLRRNS